MRKLSVVIVTFNSADTIERCLSSCYSPEFNILIIDNSSNDDTIDILKSCHDFEFKLIQNSSNLGLARANNQAIPSLQTPFLLVLNPDTYITPSAINNMISILENDDKVAVLGPATYSSEDALRHSGISRRFGLSFGPTLNIRDIFFHLFLPERAKIFFRPVLLQDSSVSTDWVSGHCIMMRSSVFVTLGGYDPQFFLSICDVIDLCKRIKLRGHKVLFVPFVSCIHIGAVSSRQQSVKPFSYYKSVDGFFCYMKKWYGPIPAFILRYFFLLYQCSRLLAYSLLSVFSYDARLLFRVHLDAFRLFFSSNS